MAGLFHPSFHYDTPSYQRIVGENVVLTDETISATARMAFKFIVARIESDHERYLETTKQNRERKRRFDAKQKLTHDSQILSNASNAIIRIKSESESNQNQKQNQNQIRIRIRIRAAAELLKEIRVGPNLALRHGREILLRFQPLCRGKQYSLH